MAGEAAKNQGEEALRKFRMALLEAVHDRKLPVQDEATIKDVAAQANIDVDKLLRDMQAPNLRQRIGEDYSAAIEDFGVFGTPTFVFSGGEAVFLKMSCPSTEDPAALFESLRSVSQDHHCIHEMKKAQR